MPFKFDAATKAMFRQNVPAWLAVAGCPLPADPDDVRIVDADFGTISATADSVVLVDGVPEPYAVVVEFQTGPDSGFDLRALLYNVLVRRRYGRPVLTVAFLMTRAAATGVTGRVFDRVGDLGHLSFSYVAVRVWELPPEPLLEGPIAAAVLGLIADLSRDQLAAAAERIRQRFAAEMPRAKAADAAAAACVIMGLKFDSDPEAFMGTFAEMIQESPVYQRWVAEGLAKGMAQGVAQGVVQGVAQGVAQGRAEGEAAVLLRQAARRLGTPAPTAIADRVRADVAAGGLDEVEQRLLALPTWDAYADR